MSNKTQLQTNNTKVASLIETLRGKATGSGGGDVKTCTVTFASNDPFGAGRTFRGVSLINGIYSITETVAEVGYSCEVVCNSIAHMNGTVIQVSSVDGTSRLESRGNIYIGTSDTTITIAPDSGAAD